MSYLSDLDTATTHQAQVTHSERITPDDSAEVRTIKLKVDHPDFTYQQGQHIGIIAPGSSEFGHEWHFRLYTIANSPKLDHDSIEIELCVRRCFYIDEFSGEQEPGIASNYLCDLSPGDEIQFTGPYGEAFDLPDDVESNLLMIGSGTGIAPFRAFIQHIHQQHPDWKGQVRLYYGARTGAENLYRNELNNDLDKYYDNATYQAFEGLSKRPWMSNEDDGLNDVLKENADEIWELVQQPNTHVYLAGLGKMFYQFEQNMQQAAGSKARWKWTVEEMKEQGRWSELIYS
jgi:ferredoxin--NADP+ reductase